MLTLLKMVRAQLLLEEGARPVKGQRWTVIHLLQRRTPPQVKLRLLEVHVCVGLETMMVVMMMKSVWTSSPQNVTFVVFGHK